MCRIKLFAGSSNGLNMTTFSARQYALQKIHSLCANDGFEVSFQNHRDFAKSAFNYTSYSARQYAQAKVEEESFVCQNLIY